MAALEESFEDLEDGEIESDCEEVSEPVKTEEAKPVEVIPEEKDIQKPENTDEYYSKSGRKKKSKSHKEPKSKDKKKHRTDLGDEDFAESIEKALRRAMNKDEDDINRQSDYDERKRYKKRKKNDGKDGLSKKRKKQDYSEEVDETEMMCVRGASPVQKQHQDNDYHSDDKDSYYSESSSDSRDNPRYSRDSRSQKHKSDRNRDRNNKNNRNDRDRDRRRGAHPMQDPDGVCLYFMQGKCHKGDDCMFSHNAQPPRKMELCKFYLMECCAKRDKCLYMHADFPCKYYHTGLQCIYKDECKFAHGPPLNEALKNILLKHIESAPKEILGDYPRLNREGALKMINSTQQKLMMQYQIESGETQEKTIPSLFELNIPKPQNIGETMMSNQFTNDKQKKLSKVRQSRWQNDDTTPNNTSYSNNGAPNVLSIRNLTGVLSPKQILDLTKMGIENLDQLGQLTVLQLNSIGISLKQITEIQLNTMSIQKLGLINTPPAEIQSPHNLLTPMATNKDLDLRVPPSATVTTELSSSTIGDFPGTDIDMRLQPPSVAKAVDYSGNEKQTNKDLIDIDQYTKDALKFASKEKENIDVCNDNFDQENKHLINETKDIDHRILPFSEPEVKSVVSLAINNIQEGDTDIRFLQPEPHPKGIEKKHRRSTTDDDEDNNLLIDEKWYSSDEEKGSMKKKSPAASPVVRTSPQLMSPPPVPHVIEPSAVISKLGDLSKIDISEEVTKLLNTMKNNLHEPKTEEKAEVREDVKLKDSPSRQSPDVKNDFIKTSSKRAPKVSIYECVDGEPTDGRRRTDVDLRQTAKAPVNSTFGDTDLRQGSSGDIDFRLGLPFKPLPNYTPASEIDGSINSHPPIPYKLVLIHIPRPDYTDIRNSTAKSQALLDPRLRKVFRLSTDDSGSDSEKPNKPVAAASNSSTTPRVDPRRKPKETIETSIQELKTPSLDLQVVIQNSDWYKELSTTQKIFINQHISTVLSMIKQYQLEKTPGKKFDLSPIQGNTVLTSIFASLGVTLGENGEFSYLPKPKDPLLKTPQMFNQNSPFGVNTAMSLGPGGDSNSMNMMNMGGVGNMNNMGGMGYNAGYNDPRGGPAPGLLGIAPNIPHGYGGNNFPNHNNYGNMPFNGNNMDIDQNFPRFPNRGRGRGGNDRWGRGGPGRGGHRDRGRGNWKNDRH